MGEWRPIETAPKDGKLILVCVAGSKETVSVGYWDDGEREWTDDVKPFWRVLLRGLGWVEATALTHWQPLPPPARAAKSDSPT